MRDSPKAGVRVAAAAAGVNAMPGPAAERAADENRKIEGRTIDIRERGARETGTRERHASDTQQRKAQERERGLEGEEMRLDRYRIECMEKAFRFWRGKKEREKERERCQRKEKERPLR